MKTYPRLAWTVTFVLAGLAALLVWMVHTDQNRRPWTRDALVSARIIPVAPFQSGVVTSCAVRENQLVQAGDELFRVEESAVNAPAEGYITGIPPRPGAYAREGEALFSVIDSQSFRITGFFRETDLANLAKGDPAQVTLMAYPGRVLSGVVESVDYGIARSDSGETANFLPKVNPTFDWIRLAQRVPVHIRLHGVPPEIELRAGLTASVELSQKQPQ